MDPIRVLVTAVGGRSVGHQILHALQLAGSQYTVVATDAQDFSFGLYQTERRYLTPVAETPDYIPALLEIVKHERIEAVVPGSEPELRVLAQNAHAFTSHACCVIVNPADVVHLCSDKARLDAWLQANDFKTPRTTTLENWEALVAEVGFPLVGKPAEQSGGSRNVVILKDEKEIEHYRKEMGDEPNVLLQEYVESADSEYTVGVVVSKCGDLIDSIVIHRKLMGLSLGSARRLNGREYKLSTGLSQGFVVKHAAVQEVCERLALKIGIRGPANIQCRVNGEDVIVFEVHPRFSGTTSIRAEVGFNEPDIVIRNFLFGAVVGRVTYQTNVATIRALRNIIVPVSTMQSVPRMAPGSVTHLSKVKAA